MEEPRREPRPLIDNGAGRRKDDATRDGGFQFLAALDAPWRLRPQRKDFEFPHHREGKGERIMPNKKSGELLVPSLLEMNERENVSV